MSDTAATLDIDLGIVREYLGRLFRSLKCSNRTGAIGAALEAMGRMMREGQK